MCGDGGSRNGNDANANANANDGGNGIAAAVAFINGMRFFVAPESSYHFLFIYLFRRRPRKDAICAAGAAAVVLSLLKVNTSKKVTGDGEVRLN